MLNIPIGLELLRESPLGLFELEVDIEGFSVSGLEFLPLEVFLPFFFLVFQGLGFLPLAEIGGEVVIIGDAVGGLELHPVIGVHGVVELH